MWGQAGFEPIIYVFGVIWTYNTTTVKSTIFEVIDGYYSNCTKTFISVIARNRPIAHDPSRKKYIFSVITVIIYSCIKVRIRLILYRYKSMRISLDHFFYCIVLYKCKTIFSVCGSIFSIICTVLGNVSKRSLITSVTTVHGLNNQK